jgi:8-oxo-dGTP pyrophosphatase MutT (NUDIX family)
VREAAEETGLSPGDVVVRSSFVDDHGGWSYTTVVARAHTELAVHALDRESADVRWLPVEGVLELPLHPGFAGTWPVLRSRI